MKILLAVDDSDAALCAIDYVARHEGWCRGDEMSVFTVQPPMAQRARTLAAPDLIHSYYEDDAEKALGPARELLCGATARVRYEWVVGEPSDAIVQKAAAGGFDLIIMGSHRRSQPAALALGSVSARVLAQSEVPVLLIR